jgi:hypothetical protein
MGCFIRMRPVAACSARTAAPALADRIAFAPGTYVFEHAGPPSARLDDFQTSLDLATDALAAGADGDGDQSRSAMGTAGKRTSQDPGFCPSPPQGYDGFRQ